MGVDCNAIDLFFFFCEVWLQIWVQAGVSAGIWVIHTAVPNLGASSSCVHMTDCLLKFDLSNMNLQTVAHLCSLLNDFLRYDKLWGPSHRVITMFQLTLQRGKNREGSQNLQLQ